MFSSKPATLGWSCLLIASLCTSFPFPGPLSSSKFSSCCPSTPATSTVLSCFSPLMEFFALPHSLLPSPLVVSSNFLESSLLSSSLFLLFLSYCLILTRTCTSTRSPRSLCSFLSWAPISSSLSSLLPQSVILFGLYGRGPNSLNISWPWQGQGLEYESFSRGAVCQPPGE